jgi:Skp family chaperone for outer membrane proteins
MHSRLARWCVKKVFAIGSLMLLPMFGDVSKASSGTAAVEPTSPTRSIVVSLQRVATESVDGRTANQRLQALAQKMSADLVTKQKEQPAPTPQELQRLAQQSQADFQTAQRQTQVELRTKLNSIVAEIAAQRGVDVVLNADVIVWSASRLDVTNEVISKLDALSNATAGK